MKERALTSAAGATGTAFLAAVTSLCCFAPAAFASLGIVGAGLNLWASFALELEPYRPYFLAVSVALLAYGYWSVYLRVPKVMSDDSGAACPLRAGRLAKTALAAATVATALAAATPHLLFRYYVP